MYELFGLNFYQWWCGLGRMVRLSISVAFCAAGAVLAWAMPDQGFLWVPLLVAGGVLLVAN